MSKLLFLDESQLELVQLALELLDAKLASAEAALTSSNAKDALGSRRRAVRLDRQRLGGLLGEIRQTSPAEAAALEPTADEEGSDETPTP